MPPIEKETEMIDNMSMRQGSFERTMARRIATEVRDRMDDHSLKGIKKSYAKHVLALFEHVDMLEECLRKIQSTAGDCRVNVSDIDDLPPPKSEFMKIYQIAKEALRHEPKEEKAKTND